MIYNMLQNDGWTNLMAGLGKRGTDKTESTEFSDDVLLTDEELSALYNGEGLGANIIDAIPDDMTKAGWIIANDEDRKIEKEMKRLKAVYHINKALKYARLFGGVLIVIVTDRGKLSDPIPVNFGTIKQLRVYSAARININTTDIISDMKNPYFEEIETFHIQKRIGGTMDVHRSRCLWFGGELCSDNGNMDLRYRYWGLSTMQRIWARLKHYGAVERAVANLMLEFNIGKYTVSNLAQILSMNSVEALDMIYTRLEMINASKSIINGVLLGEGEAYERDSANLSGVADIIDRMQMNLCAVSKLPATKLFRRSPGGMNATGESDLINYYDEVSTKQTQILESELQKLVNLIGQYSYKSKAEYPITFNSLWEPTDKEKAETEKIKAETHVMNVDRQILDIEESRTIQYPDLPERDAIDFNLPEEGVK